MIEQEAELAFADVAGIDVATGLRPARGRLTALGRRAASTADSLVPVVVRHLVGQLGLPYAPQRRRLVPASWRALAGPDDVVWGDEGDPVLLLGGLCPELSAPAARRSGISVVVELGAAGPSRRRETVPLATPWDRMLRRLGTSGLVVSTSLAVIVAAESLGIPSRAVVAATEPRDDAEAHYLATGRDGDEIAAHVEEAIERGGAPAVDWDPYPLLGSFPAGLWGEDADPTLIAAIGWRTRLTLGTPPVPRLREMPSSEDDPPR